jgi:glycerol-3-phosphate dehydrogenase subunit B
VPAADVVVVGAGLAGMTAAIALAEAGASVEVVARGHAATHWMAGGLDFAARPGAATPREGIASLAKIGGHPYALLANDVAGSLERVRGWLAAEGLTYEGELASPIRPVPTSIGGVRPASILPTAQAAALAPWSPEERLVVLGFRGFKDFWPEHVAASLTRGSVWASVGGREAGHGAAAATPPPGDRPERVEALSVELPGLEDRHNLSALTIAQLFDDPAGRRNAIDAIARALARTGHRPGRLGMPAAIGRHDHATAFAELAAAIELVPFEIPLVPPSVPGLRLFDALRSRLRASGGRMTIGGPVDAVTREGRRVTAVSTEAAARQRTVRAGAVVLATGGIAGGGLIATSGGRLVEPVLDLPVEAPPADGWLAMGPFPPDGHPLERAGIRTDASLRPIGGGGKVALENVVIAGSILAGMRYLEERCGDGVAIASGIRAAETLAKSLNAADASAATKGDGSGKRDRRAAAAASR